MKIKDPRPNWTLEAKRKMDDALKRLGAHELSRSQKHALWRHRFRPRPHLRVEVDDINDFEQGNTIEC